MRGGTSIKGCLFPLGPPYHPTLIFHVGVIIASISFPRFWFLPMQPAFEKKRHLISKEMPAIVFAAKYSFTVGRFRKDGRNISVGQGACPCLTVGTCSQGEGRGEGKQIPPAPPFPLGPPSHPLFFMLE